MLLVSFVSYGQEFTITPDGLKDKSNNEKTFVVLNVEGKTAKQLYDNAILYVNTIYKNPSAVMRGNIINEFLSFATHTNTFYMDAFIKRNIDVEYITSLTFKDGKVKYEIQELDMVCNQTRPQLSLSFSGSSIFQYSIYNNSGKLRKEDTKKDLEDYFNSNIIIMKKYLDGKSSVAKKDDF
jgi:hypothetical protein